MTWLENTGFEVGVVPADYEVASGNASNQSDDPNSGARYLRYRQTGETDELTNYAVFSRPGTGVSDDNSVTIGLAIKVEDVASADSITVGTRFECSVTDSMIGFRILADGSVQVAAAQATNLTTGLLVLGTTAAGLIQDDTWYDIELRSYPGNTQGFFDLAINGAVVLTEVDIDTFVGVGSILVQWGWWIRMDSGGNLDISIDDVRLGQSFTGTEGAMVHEILTPNSTTENDGSVVGAATAHEATDEVPPSDLEYVSLDTVDDRLLMGLTNRTQTGDVQLIRVLSTASAPVGVPTVRALYAEGGTETEGPDWVLDANPNTRYVTDPVEVNPRTGVAWTTADINALEVGAVRTF